MGLAKTEALKNELGVVVAPSALELAKACDVAVLAVKPGGIPKICRLLSDASDKCLFMSVAARVKMQTLADNLGGNPRIVRVMPNPPALVREGASGLAAGSEASAEDVALATALLKSVGACEVVDESMLDAVTGVSGSGPAYIMLAIEALADGGVRAGLPRSVALTLAAQTVKGAAALVLETGEHPAVLKDKVTSPGGTTIAGVEALEQTGLRKSLLAAVSAATARSKELGAD